MDQFVRAYRVPLNLALEKAILAKKLTPQQTEVELSSLDQLNLINGQLFATIDMDNLTSAPNIGIHYFKIESNVIYSFYDLQPNPIVLVIEPLYLNHLKIKRVKISAQDLSFEIHENGLPPLTRFTPEAKKFEIKG